MVRFGYHVSVEEPPTFTVVVLDGRTDGVRAQFSHQGQYRGIHAEPILSGDGSRLLIPNEHFQMRLSGVPPGFAVYDTADGRLVSTVVLVGAGETIEEDQFFVDATGERLYVLSAIDLVTGEPLVGAPTPFEHPSERVETPLLESYDLASGELVGDVELSALVQGRAWDPFQMPAAALSPDGRTMAFVQADGGTLTLVDTASMVIERTYYLNDGGRAASPTPTRTSEEEFASLLNPPQVQGEAVFSADGRWLFVRWARMDLDEMTIRVQSIDLSARAITADLVLDRVELPGFVGPRLDGRTWVSPDGTGVYVFAPALPLGVNDLLPPERRPWVLRRLDSETLAVAADGRPVSGAVWVPPVGGSSVSADWFQIGFAVK